MQDKPKVSIGVTYYNNEKYIAQCLESLINQTLQEIEIIIVNDCSPDNGIDIINEFAAHDDRIKVISLTENHGVAHAFNVALENATGEYFTECDSDDWVDVRMYEDLYVKAKHNYDLDFITCRSYNVIETSGICRKEKVYFVGYELCNTVLSKNDFMNNEKISVWFNIWVTLFNKDFLNKNNIKKLECASTGTDKSFFILSRVHAQKFMFTENFYYYHRIGNVSSLQHRRSELFGNYKKLFDEMENRLSLLGVLDEYALFFYKFKFIDFVRGVLKKIPVEKTLEAILQMSSVFAHDMEHIIKHKDYEEMLWIMEMKKLIASPKKYHDEYLIERFKISVIVPIYNDEEYLPKSLNSILTQTLKEIDIILVDDGSTDNSLSIIEECAYSDNRVTVVKCKNGGGGAARNAGMQYAKGKYLCFLDADDYFYPNMLEEAYNKAEKQEAEICIWRSKYVRNNKTYSAPKIQFNIDLIPKTDVFCLSDVEIDVFRVFNSSVWNKLFLKSFVDDKKLLFRETHITNDINFVYSALATAKRITTINKALLDYYSGTSDNSLDKYDLYFNEIVDNWKAFKLFLVDNGLFNEKFKNSFLSRTVEIIEYCFSQIKDNNKAKYFDYLVSNGLKAFGLNNASITEMKFDGSAHLNRFLKLKRMLQFSPEQYREYSISLVDAPINYKMIPLLFATSNTMVLALSAAIISAFENANINTFYVVNIMVNKRFDEKYKNNITSIVKSYGKHIINFVVIEDEVFRNAFMRIEHITYETYFRLVAPTYFPNINKIIYLDVDTIITGDLQELYDIRIEHSYVAGINAASYIYYQGSIAHLRKRLGISNLKNYINAGVTLLNLSKIRKDKKCQELLQRISNRYSSLDQDIINVSFSNGIKVLPFKYNAMTKYSAPYSEYENKRLCEIYGAREFEEGVRDPLIIHYADKLKPWNVFDSFLAEEWFKYAIKSSLFSKGEYDNYDVYRHYQQMEKLVCEINFSRHKNLPNNDRSCIKNYKISIIIPVYNVEKTIHQTIKSALINASVLGDCEIVIIDDGSSDNTVNIISAYAEQFSFIKVYEQEHQGSGIARNYGMALAKGEYIAFIDGDDYYPEYNTLKKLYDKAKEQNALICGGSFAELIGNRLLSDYEFPYHGYKINCDGFIEYQDWQYDYGYHRFIYNSKMLFENKILFPKYLRFQDPPFFVRAMLVAKRFYAIKDISYVLRIHPSIEWTEDKTIDLLNGLNETMQLAKENKLYELYHLVYKRYRSYIPHLVNAIVQNSNKPKLLITYLKFISQFDFKILSPYDVSEYDISAKALVEKLHPYIDIGAIIKQINGTND